MNCPRDGANLESQTIDGTRLDACPTCAGLFLDHGELNQLTDPTPGDIEFSTVDLDSFNHDDSYQATSCPRDQSTMRKVDFNVDTAIILDYCSTCRGFWLDGGELDRIRTEVKELNEAGAAVPDPLLVRISQFLWRLPLPH